ncbi:MAG: hypothetical protein WCJ80_07060 [Bacteroidota bacterium]
MKHITSLIILFLIFQTSNGQTKLVQDYKSLFNTADSLNKLGKDFSLDTALLIELHDLDAQVPSSYLEQSLRLFDAHNFDEAAVLYYIGLIRHQYYISTNSNYAPNEDWINAESMKAVYGKKFDFVLKTNIEKYILVLKLATEYCEKNDYLLSPKQNNLEKYNSQIDTFKKLIVEYTNNKETYIKEWSEERKTLLSEVK